MTEFVDELPPLIRVGYSKAKLVEFAADLRADPEHRWAKWPNPLSPISASKIPSNLSRGSYPALPPAEFEAASRDGRVYARYRPIGGADE